VRRTLEVRRTFMTQPTPSARSAGTSPKCDIVTLGVIKTPPVAFGGGRVGVGKADTMARNEAYLAAETKIRTAQHSLLGNTHIGKKGMQL
jgi:hypothetical protein